MLIELKTKNDARAQLVAFVAGAVSKDKTRATLQHVYSTGSEIAATDTHRCHTADVELKEGFYKVLKLTKTVVQLVKVEDPGVFPDYKRIIPTADKLVAFKSNGQALRHAEVTRALGNGAIDFKYFCDACPPCMTHYQITDMFSPVLFTSKEMTSVVMPIVDRSE